MTHCLAIRHVAFEHLGTLAPLLQRNGLHITYLDVATTDLTTIDPLEPELLVVLGGPIGVYEQDRYPYLVDELRLLERRITAARPVLGICLGAQLIANVLGSKVYPGTAKEIGWGPLTMTASGEKSCLAPLTECAYQVLHWHGDTFDLPPGANHLAATAITANQAFTYGTNVLGLQFHLEIDVTEIEHWLIGHAHEIAATPGITPSSLRKDSHRYGRNLAASAAKCMSRWLMEVGLT